MCVEIPFIGVESGKCVEISPNITSFTPFQHHFTYYCCGGGPLSRALRPRIPTIFLFSCISLRLLLGPDGGAGVANSVFSCTYGRPRNILFVFSFYLLAGLRPVRLAAGL